MSGDLKGNTQFTVAIFLIRKSIWVIKNKTVLETLLFGSRTD